MQSAQLLLSMLILNLFELHSDTRTTDIKSSNSLLVDQAAHS